VPCAAEALDEFQGAEANQQALEAWTIPIRLCRRSSPADPSPLHSGALPRLVEMIDSPMR